MASYSPEIKGGLQKYMASCGPTGTIVRVGSAKCMANCGPEIKGGLQKYMASHGPTRTIVRVGPTKCMATGLACT